MFLFFPVFVYCLSQYLLNLCLQLFSFLLPVLLKIDFCEYCELRSSIKNFGIRCFSFNFLSFCFDNSLVARLARSSILLTTSVAFVF